MKMKKLTLGILLMLGLLVGSLAAGAILAGKPGAVAAQTAAPCVDDDDANEAAETAESEDADCDNDHEDEANESEEANDGDEANEIDEADETVPTGLNMTAAAAQAIVEAAHPDAAALAVEYDRENGSDLFEVELDNGLDVKVDVATGEIVVTETRD